MTSMIKRRVIREDLDIAMIMVQGLVALIIVVFVYVC